MKFLQPGGFFCIFIKPIDYVNSTELIRKALLDEVIEKGTKNKILNSRIVRNGCFFMHFELVIVEKCPKS